jgi:hypothetical protein
LCVFKQEVVFCSLGAHQKIIVVSFGVSFGFLWVSLGFFGFLWVSLGFFRFLWVSLGFFGFLWVSLGFFGFLWVLWGSLGLFCVLWVFWGILWGWLVLIGVSSVVARFEIDMDLRTDFVFSCFVLGRVLGDFCNVLHCVLMQNIAEMF